MNQLISEIDRISSTTQFNTKNLLDGSLNATFQVGANSNQVINLSIATMNSTALTVNAGNISVGSNALASTAIDNIDKAINAVSQERSKLGALQNRLEYTINNLSTSAENLTAAESRIRDVDYALAA